MTIKYCDFCGEPSRTDNRVRDEAVKIDGRTRDACESCLRRLVTIADSRGWKKAEGEQKS